MEMFDLKFEEIGPISREDAEARLNSMNPDVLASTLISIGLHDDDWKWGQQLAVKFFSHQNESVVSAAILSLAHSVRVNKAVDKTLAIPALHKLAVDSRFIGKVQDALDDISAFAGLENG